MLYATDAVVVSGTRRTRDGYLVADAKAVRTGIQIYGGLEVGRPELDTVRVYRSEDEVKSPASLQSFSHAPVTVDHPAVPVTSDNWKDLAVGEVSTAATWDGNRISLPLILKDASAIDFVGSGKRELSAGYTCELVWEPGQTADGQPFDARQVNIRANHLAIVDRGRAGSECRIGDSWPAQDGGPRDPAPNPSRTSNPPPRTTHMATHIIDGHTVEMSDAAIVAVKGLQKEIGTLTADNVRLAGEVKTAGETIKTKDGEVLKLQADHKVALDAKDKEIADLKKQVLSADKLDEAVAERAAVFDAAKPVLGDGYDVRGKTVADVRRATVAKLLGDKAVEGKADEHVTIAFDALTAAKVTGPDPVRHAIQSGPVVRDHAADPHAKRSRVLQDAWKTAGTAPAVTQ